MLSLRGRCEEHVDLEHLVGPRGSHNPINERLARLGQQTQTPLGELKTASASQYRCVGGQEVRGMSRIHEERPGGATL